MPPTRLALWLPELQLQHVQQLQLRLAPLPPSHLLLFALPRPLRLLHAHVQHLLQPPVLLTQPPQLPIARVQHSLQLHRLDVKLRRPIVLSLQLLFRDVLVRQHRKLLLLGGLLLQPQDDLIQLCQRPLLQVSQLPLPLIVPFLQRPQLPISDALPLRLPHAHAEQLPRLPVFHAQPIQPLHARVQLLPQPPASVSLPLRPQLEQLSFSPWPLPCPFRPIQPFSL